MDKVIAYIRLIGEEFNSISDEKLNLWIEMLRPMVSRQAIRQSV